MREVDVIISKRVTLIVQGDPQVGNQVDNAMILRQKDESLIGISNIIATRESSETPSSLGFAHLKP